MEKSDVNQITINTYIYTQENKSQIPTVTSASKQRIMVTMGDSRGFGPAKWSEKVSRSGDRAEVQRIVGY